MRYHTKKAVGNTTNEKNKLLRGRETMLSSHRIFLALHFLLVRTQILNKIWPNLGFFFANFALNLFHEPQINFPRINPLLGWFWRSFIIWRFFRWTDLCIQIYQTSRKFFLPHKRYWMMIQTYTFYLPMEALHYCSSY